MLLLSHQAMLKYHLFVPEHLYSPAMHRSEEARVNANELGGEKRKKENFTDDPPKGLSQSSFYSPENSSKELMNPCFFLIIFMVISSVVLKEWHHDQAYFLQIKIFFFHFHIVTPVLKNKQKKVSLQSDQLSVAGALDKIYFIFHIKILHRFKYKI